MLKVHMSSLQKHEMRVFRFHDMSLNIWVDNWTISSVDDASIYFPHGQILTDVCFHHIVFPW